MPDTNEFHVRASVVETIEGSTAVKTLMGRTDPVRLWGDLANDPGRPIVTVRFEPGRFSGACDVVILRAVFDVFTEPDSTGLGSAIADELEGLITYTNLASTGRTHPVDVAPYRRARGPNYELDEGRGRITLEYDLRHTRS